MKRSKNLILGLIIVAVLLFSACTSEKNINISGFKDEKIKIISSSLEKKYTIAELAEMKQTTIKTESTSDKIGEVEATGVLLSELFPKLQENAAREIYPNNTSITVISKDGYKIKLDSEFVAQNEILLCYGINGEPLDEAAKPLRIVIPDSDSAYWARMVKEIIITY
ncbi:MAG: molybdopterin-dependent oxidoreductase [Anaerovoracaceae bacterium]